jgi:hypothetical protein
MAEDGYKKLSNIDKNSKCMEELSNGQPIYELVLSMQKLSREFIE